MRGGAGVLAAGIALVVLVGVAAASGAPLVSAGLDQDVRLGDTVYLDGGGTHVPDGELDRLSWSIETPNGDTISPKCVDCERTSFRPNETGKYDVSLTAWSDSGVERSDTLYVTVGAGTTTNSEPVVRNESNDSGGGDGNGCFISYEGDDGEAMSNQICNNVGRVVDSELSDSGEYIESYTVESGELVGEFSNAEWVGDGNWEIPADSLHHESVAIWEDYQEDQDSRNVGDDSNSENSGDSGSNYDPLEDNSATDGDDSEGSSDNPGGDYTLPPNYP